MAKRVAVIDDSPLVGGVAEQALSALGYDVRTYTDPEKALRELSGYSPAVVVCDLNMPNLSGTEVMSRIRAILPDVPVVMYTEQRTVAAAVSALQQGAFRYVVKDDSAKSLPAEVERAYEQHLVLTRARMVEAENRQYREQLEHMVQERTAALVQEHRLRERQLQEHETQRIEAEIRFRAVIEGWPEPVVVVDSELTVLYSNPALSALVGRGSSAEFRGTSVLTLFHPEEREEVRAWMEQTQSSGAPMQARRERNWVKSNGSSAKVEISTIPVLWDGRQAVMLMAKDVTELKQMSAKMMHMDRMVAVGTLAAGVGHEINNPLSYIISNVDFCSLQLATLVQKAELATEIKDKLTGASAALDDAREGAQRVRDIVRDLKTFSRSEETPKEAVDVHAVLESALAMARSEIRHRARVVKDYVQVPRITVSRSRLAQVFVNLFANAAHAIPEGKSDQHQIGVATRSTDERIEILVSDTGTGIAPEHLPRIFDPFFTTKPVGSGTGLGLSICASIIRDMGGEITAQTEVGKGTTFKVSLPAGTKTDGSASPQPSAVPGPPQRWSILLVDDEPKYAVAVQRLLNGRHEVRLAGSGNEALARLEKGERFDAVLSDVHMTGMSGMELYRTIQKRWPELAARVGFVTAGPMSEEARTFLAERTDQTFEKPGTLAGLEVFLARLTDRR